MLFQGGGGSVAVSQDLANEFANVSLGVSITIDPVAVFDVSLPKSSFKLSMFAVPGDGTNGSFRGKT